MVTLCTLDRLWAIGPDNRTLMLDSFRSTMASDNRKDWLHESCLLIAASVDSSTCAARSNRTGPATAISAVFNLRGTSTAATAIKGKNMLEV